MELCRFLKIKTGNYPIPSGSDIPHPQILAVIASGAKQSHTFIQEFARRFTPRNDVLYLYLDAKGGFVYIMTNKHNIVLYTGVTSDLISRVMEHIEKEFPKSFTARYNIYKLVYFESFDSIEAAIEREKQIKGGSRKKKINLINSLNPDWSNLWETEVKYW